MLSQPKPRCAHCGDFLPFWPSRAIASICPRCSRPLALVPASISVARFRIFSVLHAAKIVLLPVVGGAIVAFGLARMTPSAFAYTVALVLLAWGVIDVWDGTAGLESGIDKRGRSIYTGKPARRLSVAKTIFGAASLALGAAGLILIG